MDSGRYYRYYSCLHWMEACVSLEMELQRLFAPIVLFQLVARSAENSKGNGSSGLLRKQSVGL